MSIGASLPEPQASLLSGILLGAKRGLPEELREKFNIAGVSHIIVISGFHVAVVAGLLMNFGLALSLSRKQAFWLSIIGIIFFILLTGSQVSAIRAGIMGGLVLLAMYSGRLANARNGLLLAAVIMLLINPKLLRFDVGFQLSFLATIGIIYTSPYITKRLRILPEILKIRESAAMTLSAQILTLPVVVYNFDKLSLVAPLANIMVVPLVPVTMLLGALSGAGTIIWVNLGKIFSFLAWVLLSYKIKVVELLASFNFSYFEIYDLWWGWIEGYYILVLYWIYRIRKKEQI